MMFIWKVYQRLLLLLVFLYLPSCCASSESGTKRRKLDAFTITLRPLTEALTLEEASTVRNSVETVLSHFFQSESEAESESGYYPWPQGTSVTYVGLARVLENTLAEESAVQVTMDGLVYFSDTSSDLPDGEAMQQIVQNALTPESLMEALQPFFPALSSAKLDIHSIEVETPPTTKPSLAPTVTPQEDKVIAGIVEGTSSSESASHTGIIVGASGAGLAFVLFGVVLLSMHARRSKVTNTTDQEDAWREEQEQQHQHVGGVVKKGMRPSPTKTERTSNSDMMNDVERPEQPPQQHPGGFLHNMFSSHNSNSNNHTTRMPTPTQMMDDDVSSSLDFNVDDMISEFDMDSFVTIQPHIIIPVEPVESFQHQRQQYYYLKKDMLQSSDSSSGIIRSSPHHNSMNMHMHNMHPHSMQDEDTYNCALAPTDVSAATLALKPRQNSPTSTSTLVPKLTWWGHSRARKPPPPHDVPPPSSSSEADDTTTFGGDWDPDDQSMGDVTSSSESNGNSNGNGNGVHPYHSKAYTLTHGFNTAKVENKDEQTLLHHSLRNESYKMQRLRTPPTTTATTFASKLGIRHDDDDVSSSDDDYESSIIIL